jgi:arsenite methyltransferase
MSATFDPLRDQVRQGYAQIAQGQTVADHVMAADRSGCCSSTAGCCAPAYDADDLANKIGYSVEELQALPEGSNLGLSCGNPAAIAALNAGEVVLDLGSGAGFDCFLCGPKVGTEGRVIGVDMTHEMLAKARSATANYRDRSGLDNVEFRLGEIEHLPVADQSVDVVISNCVINLSTDKAQVWSEIGRVLKPGGRVSASDIALFQPLPEAVRDLVNNWIGCVAGAVLVDEYRATIQAAGLQAVTLTPKPEYVATLMAGGDRFYQQIQAALPAGTTPADYITSLDVLAVKTEPTCCGGSGCG